MNYLVHLYLSDPDPQVRLGNLMGDFVKGRLTDLDYPKNIIKGLRQHRDVDSFARHSPAVQLSKERIDSRFGYFRSILVDVFYDHFLACNWQQFADDTLEQFTTGIYQLLQKNRDLLPPDLRPVAEAMIRHNWLVSYRDVAIIELVLTRIDQRFKRATPLAEGYRELLRHYKELEQDCSRFLSEAQEHLR